MSAKGKRKKSVKFAQIIQEVDETEDKIKEEDSQKSSNDSEKLELGVNGFKVNNIDVEAH